MTGSISTCSRGEVLGVVGGSGSGKSVLLRTIVGLNRPVAGRVEVFGADVLRMSDAEQRELEKRWGVLFQDGALFSSLTVAQNIEVPLEEFYRDAAAADGRDRRAQDRLGRPARGRRSKIPGAAVGRHAQAGRALPAPWRSIRKSSSSTSQRPGSIRLPPASSTI